MTAVAQVIAVPGGGIPPIPSGATTNEHINTAPQPVVPAAQQVPGFVVPPANGAPTYTQAQVDAMLAANRAPAPVPAAQAPIAAPVPASAQITSVGEHNDAVLQSYTDAFLNIGAGLDIDKAIGKALASGDVSQIDYTYIAQNGGANAANLPAIAKAIVARVAEQTANATAAVHGIAGGKEAWDAATAAFNQSAPPYLRQVVARLLDSTDQEAIKAGAQQIVAFAQQGGFVPQAAVLQGSAAGGATGLTGISAAEFKDLHFKLDKTSPMYIQQRDDLMFRRQVGKNSGM